MAGQTVVVVLVLWFSLQLPLALVTARALVRADRRR
jgi:hypothetical protein